MNHTEINKTVMDNTLEMCHKLNYLRESILQSIHKEYIVYQDDKIGLEVLILGAFGCGAFRNPPDVVAEIFNSLIRHYNFEIVEFAVFCRDDTRNYDIFKRILG